MKERKTASSARKPVRKAGKETRRPLHGRTKKGPARISREAETEIERICRDDPLARSLFGFLLGPMGLKPFAVMEIDDARESPATRKPAGKKGKKKEAK